MAANSLAASAHLADARAAPALEAKARLRDLVWGYRLSQSIYVMTRLGIPDLLASGVSDTDELARATACHAPSLYRVLRALSAAGVLQEIQPRCFALTATGDGLRSDAVGSLRELVLMLLDEWNWRPWAHLLHAVRTGETAFAHVHGAEVFDYLAQHTDASATFDAAMICMTDAQAPAIASAYDFSCMGMIVDIGGGHGQLLAAILRRQPRLRGIVFDLPHVIGGARSQLAALGLSDRCDVLAGSFFDSVPAGADAYILRDIIHDWDDERASIILSHCRSALSERGRVLLVERHIPDNPEAALPALLTDLEMLVNVGGRERSTEEHRALLASSGLRFIRTISLGPAIQHHIIEAAPL